MKKILLLTMIATLGFAGCKPDGPGTDTPADPYAGFKDDTTSRWESGSTIEKNDEGTWVFVTDAGGNLFDSESYKTGRMSADGIDYEIVEFTGPAAVGTPEGPALRTPDGLADLHSLEIVKAADGKLWIVFKETATSPERKIVQ